MDDVTETVSTCNAEYDHSSSIKTSASAAQQLYLMFYLDSIIFENIAQEFPFPSAFSLWANEREVSE